jgi:[ribosomal protein S5]-alanine N-acetyltransferase
VQTGAGSRGPPISSREEGLTELVTPRLLVRPLTVGAVDAMITRDGAALEAATEANWPAPFEPPPNVEDALPWFRREILAVSDGAHWPHWFFMDRWSREAVGMAGLSPTGEGTLTLGYCVYRDFEGQGLTTEAVRALIDRAFHQPEVARVVATIPPWHAASLRVAEKLGMRQTGTAEDDEDGEVLVLTLERST